MIPKPVFSDFLRLMNQNDYVCAKAVLYYIYLRDGYNRVTDEIMEYIIGFRSVKQYSLTVTIGPIQEQPKEETPKVAPIAVIIPDKKIYDQQAVMDFPVGKDPRKGKHPNMIGGKLCLNEEKQKEFVIDWQIHRFSESQLMKKYKITKPTVLNYIERYRRGKILNSWFPGLK
jgi:hypothetical protein